MKHILYILAIALSIQSCGEDKILKTISEERWAVKGGSENYVKDTIVFLESYAYNAKGQQEGHLFYTLDGKLKAKEMTLFTEEDADPVGSQYMDGNDQILSYYTFEYENGQKTESKAYDAQTKELLRIEKYKYNRKGFMTSKSVFTDLEIPVSSFHYGLDQYGNEQEVEVRNGAGDVLLNEVFRITKYNDENMWTEKWGFVNDEPFSYRKRKISYH